MHTPRLVLLLCGIFALGFLSAHLCSSVLRGPLPAAVPTAEALYHQETMLQRCQERGILAAKIATARDQGMTLEAAQFRLEVHAGYYQEAPLHALGLSVQDTHAMIQRVYTAPTLDATAIHQLEARLCARQTSS
jgi:hypothetical protein